MILLEKRIEKSSIKILEQKEFCSFDLSEIKDMFLEFKTNGIIRNENFEENKWILTNQTKVLNFDFNIDRISFESERKEREIGSYNDFVNALKAFVLVKLNSIVINQVNVILYSIINTFKKTNFFNTKYKEQIVFNEIKGSTYFKTLNSLLEFIDFYHMDVNDDYIELLSYQYEIYSEYCESKTSNFRRSLGTIESIFKLGEIMDLFWTSCNSTEKEEYFPIKIWWEVTTKIPMRVTEFILTPYNCLSDEKNNYYLTIRRSNLKGSKVSPKHNIEEDYSLQKIRIDKNLYDLITEYRNIVDKYDFVPNYYSNGNLDIGSRGFLFSQKSYFNFLESAGKQTALKRSNIIDFFSTSSLKTLLNRFYRKIISGIFNYQIVSKSEKHVSILESQIEYVNPMDTRHHAIINLALNDLEPIIIKEISGHNDVESSMHYFSHVETYVKCYTYSMAKKLLVKNEKDSNRNVFNIESQFLNTNLVRNIIFKETINYKALDNGKCTSGQETTSLTDCRMVNYDCLSCYFYIPNENNKFRNRIEKNEYELRTAIQTLVELTFRYKKVKNIQEEYGTIINRIKGLSNQNALILSRIMERGES